MHLPGCRVVEYLHVNKKVPLSPCTGDASLGNIHSFEDLEYSSCQNHKGRLGLLYYNQRDEERPGEHRT